MHSLRQTRLLNPRARLVLVASRELYELRPQWLPELRGAPLYVNLVNVSLLDSDAIAAVRLRYRALWGELTRSGKTGFMLPTVNDEKGVGMMNFDFTQFTMERLFALHQLMRVYALENVVHFENDQMVYGDAAALARGLGACGVRLAMTKIGERMAPAVVFARDEAALRDMLDFILESMSRGMEHAIRVAGSNWVTDMSLTAAYFREKRAGTATLPNSADGTCAFEKAGGAVFDAAPLGHWCCGTFERPDLFFEQKDAESEVAYWDRKFEWRLNETTGMRMPVWDGHPVFNLHIHSKKLEQFGSLYQGVG
jgi:hypothetical protein